MSVLYGQKSVVAVVVVRVGRDGFSVGWLIGRPGLTCVVNGADEATKRV
jgi:hypothetical protein